MVGFLLSRLFDAISGNVSDVIVRLDQRIPLAVKQRHQGTLFEAKRKAAKHA